jgi:arylsulfatase
MLANLDENMARLDAALKETGLREDTILLFMNDNGGTAGVNIYNAGMRGHKTEYYEGGHRAAFFIRWPNGKLRGPSDLDALANVQDVFPTLVELCGLKAADSGKLDGISLAGLLKGSTDTLPDRMLVVQYGQRPEKWDCAVLWRKWRLVKGTELYDLTTDAGQKSDVAAMHGDVVKRMRDHYESWWAGIEPTLEDFTPITIGSEKENPVCLSAADWQNVYCDNMKNLREGLARNGPWALKIEQDGRYEISLRRWPKEADAPIAGPVPPFKAVDGTLPAGRALPITKARLKIADLDETKPVEAQDKAITFTVTLKTTAKLNMQSWFYDASGQELCGAYFAYVKRLP